MTLYLLNSDEIKATTTPIGKDNISAANVISTMLITAIS